MREQGRGEMTAMARVGLSERAAAKIEQPPELPLDTILQEDCIAAMSRLPAASVDAGPPP